MALYDALEVGTAASTVEIRRAFRQLSLRCHPDKLRHDPTAEERFKSINTANAILSCPFRRWLYDKHGDASVPFDKAVALVEEVLKEDGIPHELKIPEEIQEALRLGEASRPQSEEDLVTDEEDELLVDGDEEFPMDSDENADSCRRGYEGVEVEYITISDSDEEMDDLPDVVSWQVAAGGVVQLELEELPLPNAPLFKERRARLRRAMLKGDEGGVMEELEHLERELQRDGFEPRAHLTAVILQTLRFLRRDIAVSWTKGRGRRGWGPRCFKATARVLRDVAVNRFDLRGAGKLLELLRWCALVVNSNL